jgi:hypothetical protein
MQLSTVFILCKLLYMLLTLQRQQKVAYGSISDRCCNYSLLALLMMGEGITRNM